MPERAVWLFPRVLEAVRSSFYNAVLSVIGKVAGFGSKPTRLWWSNRSDLVMTVSQTFTSGRSRDNVVWKLNGKVCTKLSVLVFDTIPIDTFSRP